MSARVQRSCWPPFQFKSPNEHQAVPFRTSIDIINDSDGAAIVLSIISLAHNLKLRVIAVGVETHEQCAFVRAS